jgi:hypothetical protein
MTGTVPAECKREGCHNLVEQVPGNHRRRQYCSDICKQMDYRRRSREKSLSQRQAELRQRWGDLLPETLEDLSGILAALGEEVAQRIAAAIATEKQQVTIAGKERLEEAEVVDEEDQDLLEQAQARLADLEQQLERYRHIVDLDDRRCLEQQLLDIGEQIGYRSFLPADHLVAIGSGLEFWRSFAETADDETLAAAIVRARYYAENLIAIDTQIELRKAQRRIAE